MIVPLEESITVHKSWASEEDIQSVRDMALTFRHRFNKTVMNEKFRQADVLFLNNHRELITSIQDLWYRVERQAMQDYASISWTMKLKRKQPIPPQITMSGNGQFYKTHTDNGQNPKEIIFARTVTYILYCGGKWTGGDLALHPTRLKNGKGIAHNEGQAVKFSPEQGDLVVFPSFLRHEIEDVKCSGAWEDGRLTLNGWIHRETQDGSIVSRALRQAKTGDKVAAATDAVGIKLAYNQDEPGLLRKTLQKVRLGDKIAAMTNAAGIRQCGGCKRRQRILNGQ